VTRMAVRFVELLLRHLTDDHQLCEDNHTGLRHSKLKKGGPAYKALMDWLRDVATDSKFIFYTQKRLSAGLEGLHRVNTKYACKLYFYNSSYEARVALAQLDWTDHRELYRPREELDTARARKAGTVGQKDVPKAKKVRIEKKHYNFRRAVLKRVFNPRTAVTSYADKVDVGER
jgi:hypothetical protein